MIQSIVYSLTSLNDIDKVMIFVEGNILDKLPNSHKKLETCLDRSYGINKVINIDRLSGNSCVTVYYLGNNNSYVPLKNHPTSLLTHSFLCVRRILIYHSITSSCPQ